MGANAQTKVPTFAPAEVLTAANTNLLSNGIPVFSGTATRNDAFGGSGEKVLAEGQFAYLEDSNTTQYYDGAAWQSVSVAPTYAIFNEQQATNTAGGTFTSGSYVKRVLNTTLINTISGCTLTSSVISLPAGTYNVLGYAPALGVAAHRTRLQNTTAGTTIALGQNGFSASASNVQAPSIVDTTFTLSVTSNIELQHRCETTVNTNGLGAFCNFGDSEVYAQIQITKVA